MKRDLRARFATILAISMLPAFVFTLWLASEAGGVAFIALALIAFTFGMLAIWMASNLLVFKPLREIGSVSSLFATGDLSARIKPMQNAPTGIAQLTDSFNSLADNISEREAAMLESLAEKEILLREIHHRVKNNLQIIISLLNMQERKLEDPATIDVIRETRSRINAIALVHRGLYEGGDISVIKMDVFLERLISELKTGLGIDKQNIELSTEFEALEFQPDTAIPVALFVVETLTNAVQHGVSQGGHVHLDLKRDEDIISMRVKDNGQGVHDDVTHGTGSKLINGFARQLSGRISEDHEGGYGVTLSFNDVSFQ